MGVLQFRTFIFFLILHLSLAQSPNKNRYLNYRSSYSRSPSNSWAMDDESDQDGKGSLETIQKSNLKGFDAEHDFNLEEDKEADLEEDMELRDRDNRECETTVCSEEDSSAEQYDKPWSYQEEPKQLHKNHVQIQETEITIKSKNEDDDDNDDCDDDDDDEDESSDDEDDDQAFIDRMNCLLRGLAEHTKAISRNLEMLQSGLPKQDKSNSECKKTNFKSHMKGKWFQDSGMEESQEQCEQAPTKAINPTRYTDIRLTKPESQSDAEENNNVDTTNKNSVGNNLKVSPLLKVVTGPSGLRSPVKEDYSSLWMKGSANSKAPTEKYAEYEDQLRHLMENRDAIEKNVIRIMTPQRQMPTT